MDIKQIIESDKSIKDMVMESGLSSIWKHNMSHDTGAITAYRRNYTRNENQQRNKSLLAKLMYKGYDVIRTVGRYPEGGKTVSEVSFYVIDSKNTGNLFDALVELGEMFEQDSILFMPQGSVEDKAQAFLYGTNKDPDSFVKYHQKSAFDKAVFGKPDPDFMTLLHGRPFHFKKIKQEAIERPQTGFGMWGLSLAAKRDWKD